MQTLYGAWTVCENLFKLFEFDIDYSCYNINYTVKRQNFMENFYHVFDDSKLLVQNNYEKLNNNTDLFNLLEVQKSEINNRSSMIESYTNQL